ncbi:neural Wiskott-Aldrich syndrome protein-like [Cynara cardunculus var. scolymus]|uniref:C2 calcium-dependent membrane targeting n=1 Tax=Cynara cardunculus var. scolymus TaxID=59895 RepID=A0A118K609_CYNCS|nr:neural Wiskott-Aldrich syndrome protein-like [Cynara cardunculus var. scolymus]KVI09915.1 C2 calcium-dependent membrane targeting [Cynara cardunculus var. scolymus]
MATATSHRPPPKLLDLEITIVSAKHLKNVNWRNGDLSPYAIFWLDPDRRLATKSDDSNSTKPVWNERFLIPLPSVSAAAVLTLEIFHSKPSDTPKPLVGTLRVPIDDLPNPEDSTVIRTFELRRPSGRPSGKIRLKLALRERPLPDYQVTPQPAYYYTTAPPPSYGRYPPSQPPYGTSLPPPPAVAPPAPSPPPPHPYHYGSYTDPYAGYYQGGYYSQPPPPQTPRPFTDRQSSYGGGGGGGSGSVSGGPSAPVDYAQYEQKQRPGKVASGPGLGTGLAVGAVAGGLAGLALDEGSRYEEEKIADRVESDLNARELDDYSDYRRVGY